MIIDLTKIPFLKRLIDISSLIVEVLNDQNLFTELNLAIWFSSYVQFCSGGRISQNELKLFGSVEKWSSLKRQMKRQGQEVFDCQLQISKWTSLLQISVMGLWASPGGFRVMQVSIWPVTIPPRADCRATNFFRQNPRPRDSFSVQNSGPRVGKKETKSPPPGIICLV